MSFLRRLLGKPPKPQRDPRGINEDWCVGDTAECLVHSWHTPPLIAVPRKGLRYRVTGIVERPGFRNTQVILTGLCLEGFGDLSWCCHSFRKIRATLEPASEEFRAFLRDSLKGPVEAARRTPITNSEPVSTKAGPDSRTGQASLNAPCARPATYSNTDPVNLEIEALRRELGWIGDSVDG